MGLSHQGKHTMTAKKAQELVQQSEFLTKVFKIDAQIDKAIRSFASLGFYNVIMLVVEDMGYNNKVRLEKAGFKVFLNKTDKLNVLRMRIEW